MKRVIAIAAAALVVIVIASQFVIPAIGEHAVESRLTEGGGSADVSLSAFPAGRLLFGDGERFSVTASELDLDLADAQGETFEALDGFDEVDLEIASSTAGPFGVESFSLTREGAGATYHLVSSSTTSGAELLEFGAESIGVLGAPLIGALAGLSDDAAAPIPIELDMDLASGEGRIRVVSGGGTIAGYPTGPLAELLTAAIVVRL